MNVYDNEKWGVLICGPCNVLAAKSFEEAHTKAAELNKIIAEHIKPRYADNENYPIVFAQIDLWENISSGEHIPDETIWENAFT